MSNNENSVKGATTVLAWINIGVYILTSIWGGNLILTQNVPIIYLGFSLFLFINGFFWTPITSIFVHSSIAHIGANLIFLLLYGFRLEEEGFSDKAIYYTYMITGIVAGILGSFFFNIYTISVGASGAVFGLLGANMGYEKKNNNPAYRKMVFAALILFIFSNTSPNTNIFAHLIGIVSGYFIGQSDWFHSMKTEIVNPEKYV